MQGGYQKIEVDFSQRSRLNALSSAINSCTWTLGSWRWFDYV
jgi:hypothetical protein